MHSRLSDLCGGAWSRSHEMYIILHACVQDEEAWCLQEDDAVPLLWLVSLAAPLLILAQIFLGETHVLEKVVEVVVENLIQPWAAKSRSRGHGNEQSRNRGQGNEQQPHFHRILDTCSRKRAKRVRTKSPDQELSTPGQVTPNKNLPHPNIKRHFCLCCITEQREPPPPTAKIAWTC